jgi:hypothetical protein
MFEGVGRGLRVPGGHGDRAFADGDIVDAAFLEQDDHVLDDARGGDHPPPRKVHRAGPEGDVRFDEDPCTHRQPIKASAPMRGLLHRIGFFPEANNGDAISIHGGASFPAMLRQTPAGHTAGIAGIAVRLPTRWPRALAVS